MGKQFNATRASLEMLRSMGYVGDIVERSTKFGRLDYLRAFDIVCISPVAAPLAVQATTEAHVADRLAKMRGVPGVRAWLQAGGEAWILGWGHVKVKRGGTAFSWECKRKVQVTLADLDAAGPA